MIDNDNPGPEIPGGFVLLSRQVMDSDLTGKPPMFFKLWIWLLCRARRKANGKFNVGEVFTSIDEMREAMSWYIGFRKIKPTKNEIRKAYESFMKEGMATTRKTTRGLVISLSNFEKYQNPKSYEAHTESPTKNPRRTHERAHYTQEGERGKKDNKTETVTGPEFDLFWKAYPKKEKKKEARQAWQRAERPPIGYILEQLEKYKLSSSWTKDGGRYIPHPTTWINGERWNDDPGGYSGSTGYNWREEEDRPKDWSTVPNSDWILEDWPGDTKTQ